MVVWLVAYYVRFDWLFGSGGVGVVCDLSVIVCCVGYGCGLGVGVCLELFVCILFVEFVGFVLWRRLYLVVWFCLGWVDLDANALCGGVIV